jgi:hypothetical protein
MNICNEVYVLKAVSVKVTFFPEDGGGKFLRNVGVYLPNYAASHFSIGYSTMLFTARL